MQSGISISDDGKVTGTLMKLTSGQLVTDWGEGYFIAMKWSGIAAGATSFKVGIQPTEGAGMIEAINDPDHNGVFKVTDKNRQDLVFITSNSGHTTRQTLDLSGLTLA